MEESRHPGQLQVLCSQARVAPCGSALFELSAVWELSAEAACNLQQNRTGTVDVSSVWTKHNPTASDNSLMLCVGASTMQQQECVLASTKTALWCKPCRSICACECINSLWDEVVPRQQEPTVHTLHACWTARIISTQPGCVLTAAQLSCVVCCYCHHLCYSGITTVTRCRPDKC